MNIFSAINHGAKYLKRKFILSPYLDSEILMTKALKKNREYVLLNPKQYMKNEDFNYFNHCCFYFILCSVFLPW